MISETELYTLSKWSDWVTVKIKLSASIHAKEQFHERRALLELQGRNNTLFYLREFINATLDPAFPLLNYELYSDLELFEKITQNL